MADAVQRLRPNAKVAIGPSIETGFYYDFDTEPFEPGDIERIETEMRKIIEAMPVGQVSQPIVQKNGVGIIMVCGKTAGGTGKYKVSGYTLEITEMNEKGGKGDKSNPFGKEKAKMKFEGDTLTLTGSDVTIKLSKMK